MITYLFETIPEMGIIKYFHYDELTDEATIETFQVIDEDLLKGQYNQFDERSPWKDGLNKVASIPGPIYGQMLLEGKIEDEKYMSRWLNDRDNMVLRTRPGRI